MAYEVPPTRNAYLSVGRPYHELSVWDRKVIWHNNIKVHLLGALSARPNITRCGRPLPKVIWTEDGVEAATCDRCKRLYDIQED